MKRFGLATQATLVGVLLAAGCASPCGGCGGGGGLFNRMSMFRGRTPCPCECCSSCNNCSSCGGGMPLAGGSGPMMSDGPLLEPPGPPLATMPPPGAMVPGPMPSLGAPAVPVDPNHINPVPAQPFSTDPSSRVRRR